MNKYKIIAIDLDDTLLDDNKNIPSLNKEALINASKLGIKIVIASGRSPMGIVPVIKDLNLYGIKSYIIAFNGAAIYETPGEKLIFHQFLNGKDLKDIYSSKPEDIYIHFYKGNLKIYANKKNEYTDYGVKINNTTYELFDINDIKDDEEIIKVLYTGNEKNITKAIDKAYPIYNERFSLMRSAPIYYEFLPKNISKGQALKKIAEMENISMDQVMAFGDNGNDLEMVKLAGMGIAMQNSLDKEVLKHAKYITINNNDGGVGFAINKIIFDK